MSDDYLWDKQGEPDAEVAALERLLSPLEYRGLPPLPPRRRRSRAVWIVGGAVVAAVVTALFLLHTPPVPRPQLASWPVSVHGQASTDGHALSGAGKLPIGALLDTGSSHARLTVADIGAVELEPNTLVRIVETGPKRHELQLGHGALSAEITARPGVFAVRTRYVTAIDLGCAFHLESDVEGVGHLRVTSGAVALTDGKREVAVPAGSECNFDEHGPGTPYFSDATPRFRSAMAHLEIPTLVPVLLEEARLKDVPTLRQLVTTANPDLKRALERRIADLESPTLKTIAKPKPKAKLKPYKKPPNTKLAPYAPSGP